MEDKTWTVGRMLKWTTAYLTGKGDEHPRLSAEWLISTATGLTRVEIYMSFQRPLSTDELALMHDAVLRRGRGEPLQYVTGEMPFRHIILRCEKGVLIPRPETEILVDAALEGVDEAMKRGQVFDDIEPKLQAKEAEALRQREEAEAKIQAAQKEALEQGAEEPAHAEDQELLPLKPHKKLAPGPRVLEIGCGTGCIALSIASERPGTHVVTTDISEKAIALAERNRAALDLVDNVDIIQGDLASGVDPALMGTFAVLVSNPPYIPTSVLPTLPEEVIGFEPGLALDGGEDGLDVFRRLVPLGEEALLPGGMFTVELFEDALAPAAVYLKERGTWEGVEIREDLTHRPRVLVARKKA